MVFFIVSRQNTFVGGTIALLSDLLVCNDVCLIATLQLWSWKTAIMSSNSPGGGVRQWCTDKVRGVTEFEFEFECCQNPTNVVKIRQFFHIRILRMYILRMYRENLWSNLSCCCIKQLLFITVICTYVSAIRWSAIHTCENANYAK